MDCEYFLGAGQHSEKHLWAGNRHAQIAKMRELYEMIPDKPESLLIWQSNWLCALRQPLITYF
ncbi:LPD11 domain-containing protein [Dorea formicigenerans]|uniref:LPD11 domain-containing protein n=1 Tax=Dorea formicigenerans TaxID=39486 RepID=UPI00207927D1|nr:LPD11 domain-containing protein [Dorea formicigenerans]